MQLFFKGVIYSPPTVPVLGVVQQDGPASSSRCRGPLPRGQGLPCPLLQMAGAFRRLTQTHHEVCALCQAFCMWHEALRCRVSPACSLLSRPVALAGHLVAHLLQKGHFELWLW